MKGIDGPEICVTLPLPPATPPGRGGAGRLKGLVLRGGGLGVKTVAVEGIESVVISEIVLNYSLLVKITVNM